MMIKIIRIPLLLVVFLSLNAEKSVTYAALVFGKILWVIDGDTYQISHAGMPAGEPVRARHFDTPEKGDLARCEGERIKALQATEAARRLLRRGAVVLLSDFGRDRYGRLLATITLADGRDLATVMIGSGLAVPYEGGKKSSWCQPCRRRRNDGLRKGLSAPRTVKGKCRAAPVIGGRDAPKIRKRIASRPSGFGSYPAQPPTLDRAHPDSTTGKRFAGQRGIGPHGELVRGSQMLNRLVLAVLRFSAVRRFGDVTVYRDADDRWTYWAYNQVDQVVAAFDARRMAWFAYSIVEG